MLKRKIFVMCILPGLFMLLAACSESTKKNQSKTAPNVIAKPMERNLDARLVSEGEAVFARFCSGCHGIEAQGAPNWRKPIANGKYPPPPLNGRGHAWHHSRDVIKEIVRNGSQPGQGNMPAWKDKLSDQQIEAVITWLQSRWPNEVYNAWYEMHGNK